MIRWIVLALFVLAAAARAEDEPPETSSGDVPLASIGATPLLDERAPWRWELVVAPRLAPQIGAVAISGLDAVAKRGPVIDVLGDAVPPPAAWPYDVKGTAAAIPAPPEGQRIAAAFGIATFALTQAQQGLEVLELKLKYEDGVAVWLNGIEIVRQGLPRGPTTTLAVRPHGPEWETFFVPVAPGLQLADAPTAALGIAKRLLNQAMQMDRLDHHLDAELTELARIADGPNFGEGLAAFFARRAPRFGVE